MDGKRGLMMKSSEALALALDALIRERDATDDDAMYDVLNTGYDVVDMARRTLAPNVDNLYRSGRVADLDDAVRRLTEAVDKLR